MPDMRSRVRGAHAFASGAESRPFGAAATVGPGPFPVQRLAHPWTGACTPPGKAVPTMARWRATAQRSSYLSSLTDFVRNPRNPRARGRRRMVAALAATAVVIGLGTTWAGSALATSPVSAAVTPAATTTGPITGYQGLCLDDRSASTTNSN